MTIEPSTLRFTETHEWVAVQGDTIRIGISEYWQDRLSDITHVELPEPDDHHYEEGEDMGVVESLEIAADFHAPLAGVIVAINSALLATPELINSDPYGAGWIAEMQPDNLSDVDDLLDFDEYDAALPDDIGGEDEE